MARRESGRADTSLGSLMSCTLDSYAEMDGVAKNAISHRYRALEKLRLYLTEQGSA
jgi:hypothetical protein